MFINQLGKYFIGSTWNHTNLGGKVWHCDRSLHVILLYLHFVNIFTFLTKTATKVINLICDWPPWSRNYCSLFNESSNFFLHYLLFICTDVKRNISLSFTKMYLVVGCRCVGMFNVAISRKLTEPVKKSKVKDSKSTKVFF